MRFAAAVMSAGTGHGSGAAPRASAASACAASSAFICASTARLFASDGGSRLQVFVQVRLDLAFGLDHEAEAAAVVAERGQRADREAAGEPERIEQARPILQGIETRGAPGEMLALLVGGIEQVRARRGIARERGLPEVQRLRADLADMIDAHEPRGVPAFARRRARLRPCRRTGSSRCAGGAGPSVVASARCSPLSRRSVASKRRGSFMAADSRSARSSRPIGCTTGTSQSRRGEARREMHAAADIGGGDARRHRGARPARRVRRAAHSPPADDRRSRCRPRRSRRARRAGARSRVAGMRASTRRSAASTPATSRCVHGTCSATRSGSARCASVGSSSSRSRNANRSSNASGVPANTWSRNCAWQPDTVPSTVLRRRVAIARLAHRTRASRLARVAVVPVERAATMVGRGHVHVETEARQHAHGGVLRVRIEAAGDAAAEQRDAAAARRDARA